MEPTIPGPDPVIKPPRQKAPAGACDCHSHVFGPQARYPLSPARGYTPPEASLESYRAMLEALGIERAVIVQPSIYGTDNACTREAVEALGARGRGVAVIDDATDDRELDRLHDAGFRGTRFNLVSKGGVSAELLERTAARIAERGWHIQVFATPKALVEMADRLSALPVEVVVDHLGWMKPEAGPTQPGFQALLGLLADGRAYVKLSGAYRVDTGGPPWPGAAPFAKALIAAAPDRLVWGTDWPHPDVTGPMPNDGELFDALLDWTDDPATRRRILSDTPARLYDFA